MLWPKSADYIIVGGGPAGFVLAEQLSRDPKVTVLLIEAGPNASDVDDINVPGFAGHGEFSKYIWNYNVTPQKELNGITPHLAQGKLVGGGTGVGLMNYNRGARSFNAFEATTSLMENTLKSDFKPLIVEEAYGDGPVYVTQALKLDGFDPNWENALRYTLDLPEVDFNSGVGIGVSYGVQTIHPRNRTRHYAFPAYASLMLGRPNIDIRNNVHVRKINFTMNKRADSITCVDTLHMNAEHIVEAREIILCAGAIGSPRLLMLSGIGPLDHLEELGILPVQDSPEVGNNLRDHNYASMDVEVTNGVYTLSKWQDEGYLHAIKQLFYKHQSGPLANAPASSFALLRVPDDALPPGKAGDFHRSLPRDRGQLQMQYANVAPMPNTAAGVPPVITVWVALTQPEASGMVRLRSASYMAPPLIDTAYFGTEGDRACILWGYKKLREVLRSPELKDVIVKEMYPSPEVTSDVELWNAITGAAQTYHHPTGTVALGKVLDANFRVKGVRSLRVVDSSVFPCPTNCHPEAAVYALAHVAAKQIREADGFETLAT